MENRVEVFRRVERQCLRDRLGTLGLQTMDGMVLRLLEREGRLRQEDIAHRAVLDKGAVARSLARLEARGLVERTVPSRCRREKMVTLTPAGEDAAKEIETVLQEWQQVCYRGFSLEERQTYEAFLTRIIRNVLQFKEEEQDG